MEEETLSTTDTQNARKRTCSPNKIRTGRDQLVAYKTHKNIRAILLYLVRYF